VASDLSSVFKFSLPRRSGAGGGVASTPTFRASNAATALSLPDYRDHMRDVFDERINATDSRALLELLFRNDPDVSAAVNAYLTVADTEPMFFIKDVNGEFDRDAYKTLETFKNILAHQTDMKLGYEDKPGLSRVCEQMRHMLLLRGAVATELVFAKGMIPSELRNLDPSSIRWYEKTAGARKPTQVVAGQTAEVNLDIPTFFWTTFRQSPVSAYPTPPFVSAINTIASRQRVINDLYRIMAATGYPRIDVTVLEQVLTNAAPPSVRSNSKDLQTWVNARVSELRSNFASIRPDESLVHTDSVQVKILNDKAPAIGVNVENIISVLNAQNQAGLKSVATILGRGESGVNTASIESRIFALNADALNLPVAHVLSRAFTVALQLAGHPVFVEARFRKAELRPVTELEPQLVMRQARLLDALSLGVITDEEFHIEMFGRLPPDGAPTLSGTNFRTAGATPDTSDVSPNSDPNGRALSPEGSAGARSNATKKPVTR
jgi:hypothetical protein